MGDEQDREHVLSGGNATPQVVRVGDTVRKPWLPTTENTVAFMNALLERGIDLPAPRGRDETGRLVLDFVPGALAMEDVPLDPGVVRRVGALVRAIHDASEGLSLPDGWDVLLPADEPDLLCHHDLAPWNLVIDGERLVFIDWDGAGPSTRLWDLAYASIAFGHLFPEAQPVDATRRLVAFLDGYGADDALRASLPTAMVRRARAMYDLLESSYESGREPWGSMFLSGHGTHWEGTAAYIAMHETVWSRALTHGDDHKSSAGDVSVVVVHNPRG